MEFENKHESVLPIVIGLLYTVNQVVIEMIVAGPPRTCTSDHSPPKNGDEKSSSAPYQMSDSNLGIST